MRVGEAMLSRRRDAPLWPWIALVVLAAILIGLAALKHYGKI
jgi:hypothetical protein